MKYPLLSLALLAGSLGTARAQTPEVSPPANQRATLAAPGTPETSGTSRFGVGATGGGAYTSFLGSDATTGWSASYRWGYQAGLTADLGLSESLAFHPEALYAQKGAKFSADARNRTLAYVDVPLLLRYYPGGAFQANTAFVEAGPRVSALLAAKNDADTDTKAEFNRFDAGVVLGAGYRLASGLSLGLRYDIGITHPYQAIPAAASGGRADFQPNASNDAFSLLLGYTFGFKSTAPVAAPAAAPTQP